ncbi:Hypothetical predicted protein [Mytilus galloprovincialis]|uniref:PML C-terminal domain-containing protein n=1 Tax=Mytilus galloprovincialis TaxID=29158 RepID=A0A8B6EPG4_MYTGA|nr:Hypothetical predicted protein [Mytilus galloprovincialis]
MLVDYNCKLFDARRLLNNMTNLTCYAAFRKCVSGLADTLPFLGQKFPGLNRYSQQKLFEHFCKEQYNAHNAVDDVESLHKLMTISKVEKQDVLEFSFTVEAIAENMKYDKMVKVDAESFEDLEGKYMSAQMAVKCAQSGLKKCHLDFAFNRKGFRGLIDLLSQRRQDGSPRVTKTADVIKKNWILRK